MSAAAGLRRIWLCADDYGISPGVNRAIRDLIERGRLNATSVMMVGPAIERGEIEALQTAAKASPRCAIGLHVTGKVSKGSAATFGVLIWFVGGLYAFRQALM